MTKPSSQFLFCFFLFFLLLCSSYAKPLETIPEDPFIYGENFAKLCKFQLHSLGDTLDVSKVEDGDLIFVNNGFLKWFFQKYHQKIPSKYILISHLNTFSSPKPFEKYLNDPNLCAWFCKNINMWGHPKVSPLPLGIFDTNSGSFMNSFINALKEHNPPHKEYLALLTFITKTHPMRWNFPDNFEDSFYIRKHAMRLSQKAYFSEMLKSKLVLCPRGSSVDTYRAWESIILGAIPIILHSEIDIVYKDLPVLLIEDFKEISEKFLLNSYEHIQEQSYRTEKLYMSYWKNILFACQNDIKTYKKLLKTPQEYM